ncbi:MAG: hypothetical protein E6H41_12250, partial [Betaproteobacteria bacterium]
MVPSSGFLAVPLVSYHRAYSMYLSDLFAAGLAIGCVYSLVALGFAMIIRATGIIHFAQGELLMLGSMSALSTLWLMPRLPAVLVLACGMIASGVLAVAMEFLVYRPLRLRRGLGAAALSGAVLELDVPLLRGRRLAAAGVDHGVRRGADGPPAAVPQAHAHGPRDAGGGAGRRGRAAHGREPHPHDDLHLRHRRDDGGSGGRDVRVAVLLVLRDGLRARHQGLRRRHARRPGQPRRRDARRHPLRPDRDLQRGVRVVGVQGRDRHGAAHRHPPLSALGAGGTVESALLRRIITGVVLAALFLLPVFEPHQFVLHMLSLVAISATVALGLQLLLGFSGQLSIGQAAFYGIGAYASGLLSTKLGLSFPLAFFAAGLIAAVTSLLMVPITR